jgi:ABC-type multidrug transport system fused ATPase/permease subunit
VIIGSSVLLIVRLGWPGALGMAVVLLVIPISNFISRHYGKLLQEINIYKDKRIKTTTEMIEGIKYIKLYGWEIAFRRIIQNLREQEILNYKKLSFSRSVERAAGSSLGYFAVIGMFITVHYFSSTELTIPLIFSTLEIIIGIRMFIRSIVSGFNFYY